MPKHLKETELSDCSELSSEDELDNDSKPNRIAQRERRKVEKERASRTLFVGNLPSSITKKKILQLFRKSVRSDTKAVAAKCVVESVRLRGAVPVTGGTSNQSRKRALIQREFSRGKDHTLIAFVVLSSKDGIPAALKLNGHLFPEFQSSSGNVCAEAESVGRHIRVDTCVRIKPSYDSQRSIFVGNLPFSVSEEQVRQAFNQLGEVVNVRLVRDSVTGAVKGIGYVEFHDPNTVALAIRSSNQLEVGNRKVRVEPCKSVKKVKIKNPKKIVDSNNQVKDNKMLSVNIPSNLRGVDRKNYIKRVLGKRKKKRALEMAKNKKSSIIGKNVL